MTRRIVILGGYGRLGRCLSRSLAADPAVECVIAGRSREHAAALARELGAGVPLALEARDPEALRTALVGAFAVVDASGAFGGQDYTLAKLCIQAGAHYLDVGSTRAFVAGIERLHEAARRNGCLVVAGAGTLPALSAALADALAPDFGTIEEIEVAYAPAPAAPHGRACLAALLEGVGAAFRVYERGRWRSAFGWSEPRTVRFSAPLGRRRLYLRDAPELELFVSRYAARSVSLRTALPGGRLARTLALLGWLRRRGLLDAPARLSGALLARGRGPAGGAALRVTMRGRRGRTELERYAELVARGASGEALDCGAAVVLLRQLVAHGAPVTGAMPCVGLVTLDALRAGLKDHDIALVMG